jgi:type IV pilus assembly protein PilC
MPVYKYVAKNKDAQTISGIIEVNTQSEAEGLLRSEDLIIISLTEAKSKGLMKRKASRRISLDDLVVFSRQLATMIDSGMTIVASLDILRAQIENKAFAEVISRISQDINAGTGFCNAVAKYPAVFSEFYINMIKAGEVSGTLDEVLERLAIYLEKSAALRRKIQASLVYPAVVVTMAALITSVLLIKVVPTFKSIFETLGGKLPLPTQILILVSDVFRQFFLVFLIILVLFFVLLKRYSATARGRYRFDRLILRLPVFGTLFLKAAVARFSRTFSTLVKSGIPILNALEIVARTAGNKVIEEATENSREAVRQGESISGPLEKSKIFPVMVVRMIGVGEKTGELEKMLSKIADFYEEQVDIAVSGLTSIIEPIVIAFLGIVIGGIVIALFLPIFKISELVAK